jgi:hypothetical protein
MLGFEQAVVSATFVFEKKSLTSAVSLREAKLTVGVEFPKYCGGEVAEIATEGLMLRVPSVGATVSM